MFARSYSAGSLLTLAKQRAAMQKPAAAAHALYGHLHAWAISTVVANFEIDVPPPSYNLGDTLELLVRHRLISQKTATRLLLLSGAAAKVASRDDRSDLPRLRRLIRLAEACTPPARLRA